MSGLRVKATDKVMTIEVLYSDGKKTTHEGVRDAWSRGGHLILVFEGGIQQDISGAFTWRITHLEVKE